jgi:ABC-type Zn2+ transport system substrate-binding protein/surface adhesin
MRKKNDAKLAIKHQYELKLSDIARIINEDVNMNIGIYRHESLNG